MCTIGKRINGRDLLCIYTEDISLPLRGCVVTVSAETTHEFLWHVYELFESTLKFKTKDSVFLYALVMSC